MVLISLVERALQSAHWRTNVETGRYTFPLGNNNRNVKDQEDDDRDSGVSHMQSQVTVSAVYESVGEL